jgi:hypothetical protein
MTSKIGYIYGIFSDSLNQCYIGSTWENANKRFCRHKSDFKRWKKGTYGYCSSFSLLDKCDDAYVDVLDCIQLNGEKNTMRKQLRASEQEWIDFFEEMTVNSIKHPGGFKMKCRPDLLQSSRVSLLTCKQEPHELSPVLGMMPFEE